MDPTNSQVIYAAYNGSFIGGGIGNSIFQTTDGGTTWTSLAGTGFPPATDSQGQPVYGRIGFGLAPSSPSTI